MDKQTQNNINKDLILRERLAIERTAMANDTTLLAFIRTALYFSIAGMSVNSLLKVRYGIEIEILFWVIALIILVIGIIKYRKQKRSLKISEKHIGDYKLNWMGESGDENKNKS
jgi:putative membrane protein